MRWDFGADTVTDGTSPCVPAICFNVVMRSYPTSGTDILRSPQASNWEGTGLGLDRWAVLSAARAKAYPRDTRGDAAVTTCGAGNPIDANNDGVISETEISQTSQNASPDLDSRRRWEHGGWKSGSPGPDPLKNPNPYQAALTLFHGWEDERVPHDCEPLQRAFGPQGETWGTFGVYSIGDGWVASP